MASKASSSGKFSSIAQALVQKKGGISLRGWIKRKRDLGNNVFWVMRDSSGEMQVVVDEKIADKKTLETAKKVLIESSLEVTGKLVEDARAPGGVELKVEKLNVVNFALEYPIQKDFSEEFLLNVRHLWLRSKKMTDINKIRHTVLLAAREYYDSIGWYETSPAIVTPSACEGGTTLFELDYFGQKRYLSQSAQMYLEVLIYSLENVWSLTPSFRAEPSKTARHLTEYWHLEGEAAWMKMEDMMGIIERMVEYICKKVVERNTRELIALGRDPEDLKKVKAPFKKMTYTEALKIAQKKTKADFPWGSDLSIKEEKAIGENETTPFFIYNYPTKIKPFYVKENPANHEEAFSFDLQAPEGYGEISSGGQREDDVNIMIEKIKKDKIPIENYQWYLDLRRYGSVPHSGFGLGIERLMRWICKLETIKDTIPFPRTMNRSYP